MADYRGRITTKVLTHQGGIPVEILGVFDPQFGFLDSGTPSWLQISTESSRKGFHFKVKSVRIAPFQQ